MVTFGALDFGRALGGQERSSYVERAGPKVCVTGPPNLIVTSPETLVFCVL